MNLNHFDELKEENIISLYDDVIEGQQISGVWFVRCNNGTTGTCFTAWPEPGEPCGYYINNDIGYCAPNMCGGSGGSAYKIDENIYTDTAYWVMN